MFNKLWGNDVNGTENETHCLHEPFLEISICSIKCGQIIVIKFVSNIHVFECFRMWMEPFSEV